MPKCARHFANYNLVMTPLAIRHWAPQPKRITLVLSIMIELEESGTVEMWRLVTRDTSVVPFSTVALVKKSGGWKSIELSDTFSDRLLTKDGAWASSWFWNRSNSCCSKPVIVGSVRSENP